MEVASALAARDPSLPVRPVTVHVRAVQRAREILDAQFHRTVSAEELEAATALDRYTLARQFRAHFGTSPYRYLLMRRLDRASYLIHSGQPRAEVALDSGFFDQAHLTRRFKQAYGVSPGRWRRIQIGDGRNNSGLGQ